MTRILSVSSSRADVGHQTMVWRALTEATDVDLHIFFTGMHMAEGAVRPTGFPSSAEVHCGGADIGGQTKAAAPAIAEITATMGALCAAIAPDLVAVFGDRLDMLPAAIGALPTNVPLVHLHGGELSLGAIDDRIRHALTKLAHVHCVAHVEAAERVNAMGEEPWRIHVTGGAGLDTLRSQPNIPAGKLAADIGFAAAELPQLRLVTVHPETNVTDPFAAAEAVFAALETVPGPTLITAANADPGGAEINRKAMEFADKHEMARFRDTLGGCLYANVMRRAQVMVGNSSSGIVEAGFFGMPVINVGGRQFGRTSGLNVRNCAPQADRIAALLTQVPNDGAWRVVDTPYGDGCAAPRIAAFLNDLPDRKTLLAKQFSFERGSFTAPWENKTPKTTRIDAAS